MQNEDEPSQDISEIGQPMSHEILVRAAELDSIFAKKGVTVNVFQVEARKIKSLKC